MILFVKERRLLVQDRIKVLLLILCTDDTCQSGRGEKAAEVSDANTDGQDHVHQTEVFTFRLELVQVGGVFEGINTMRKQPCLQRNGTSSSCSKKDSSNLEPPGILRFIEEEVEA